MAMVSCKRAWLGRERYARVAVGVVRITAMSDVWMCKQNSLEASQLCQVATCLPMTQHLGPSISAYRVQLSGCMHQLSFDSRRVTLVSMGRATITVFGRRDCASALTVSSCCCFVSRVIVVAVAVLGVVTQ